MVGEIPEGGRIVIVKTFDYENGISIALSGDAQIRLHPMKGCGLWLKQENPDTKEKQWFEYTGNIEKFINKVFFKETGK